MQIRVINVSIADMGEQEAELNCQGSAQHTLSAVLTLTAVGYVSLRIPCAFPVRETISIEKGCAAAGPKPRRRFHMNLLRRLVAAFRIDFYCYECPDGQSAYEIRRKSRQGWHIGKRFESIIINQ